MKKLSHYDAAGSARMVDVSAKLETRRMAREGQRKQLKERIEDPTRLMFEI